MPSIASEMLRARALPALRALFAAFDEEERGQAAWIASVVRGDPEIEADGSIEVLREAFRDQLYTIAGCIVVVGDGLIKACALENLDQSPDLTRSRFGNVIGGNQRFGAALQAGGNAFRHYSEWRRAADVRKNTGCVLKSLGIPADESTCYHILRLAQTVDIDSFLNAIDATCQDIEVGATCATCGHPASSHRREDGLRGSGCSYQVGIAEDLQGQIAAVTVAVISRTKTGQYNCTCQIGRYAVVDAWLRRCSPISMT